MKFSKIISTLSGLNLTPKIFFNISMAILTAFLFWGLARLLPAVFILFVLVFVFVAEDVDGAETVLVNRTVTLLPPKLRADELPEKL